MEITTMIALFSIILGVGWRLERKIDKASADHRAEMAALRKENQTTRTELTDRIDKTMDRVDKAESRLRGEIQTTRTELTDRVDKTADRVDKAENRLRGEIQTTRTELTGQIDKTETRLREEIQVVGDKVETLEKRVGHYEQRAAHIEGALNMELGASPVDDPTAHPIRN